MKKNPLIQSINAAGVAITWLSPWNAVKGSFPYPSQLLTRPLFSAPIILSSGLIIFLMLGRHTADGFSTSLVALLMYQAIPPLSVSIPFSMCAYLRSLRLVLNLNKNPVQILSVNKDDELAKKRTQRRQMHVVLVH